MNRKEHLAIVVTNDDFPNVELFTVNKWFKVIKQGPPDVFFDIVNNDNDTEGNEVNMGRGQEEEVEVENPATTLCMNNFSQIDPRDPVLNVAT